MRKMLVCIILLFWLGVSLAQYPFPYNLKEPSLSLQLPEALKEISGISLCDQQQYIWAIQDEEGILFKLDVNTGVILDSIVFWKEGDYEGIEVVNKEVYILKSSGTIYKVQMVEGDRVKVDKYNDYLEKDDDAEGLAYDVQNQRLLIACKKNKGEKCKIYGFDLATKTLLEDEIYKIKKKEVIEFLEDHQELKMLEKLEKMFDKKDFELAPSAIAIHPDTQEIYLLSSQGKTLFVLNSDGTIAHIEKMSKEVHVQPEGLCFDKNGNLYISNEGKDGVAKLYRFDKIY